MAAQQQDPSRFHSRAPRLALVVTQPITARYLLRGQAAFLRQQGFEVWMVTSPGDDLTAFEASESVAVARVPMRRRIRPLADLVALGRLVAVFRRLRPDLVNASTPKAGVLGILAARLARVPVRVYTLRGLPMETTRGLRRALLHWVEKRTAAQAHAVVCVGPSLRDRCLKLGITTPEKAILIANGSSNGVDTERFRPTPERREQAAALRRDLAIPADAPVIGCVGRFTRDKGLEDLTAAFFEGVVDNVPGARLLLVGDFEDGDPTERSTRQRLETDPRVSITGWVPDSAPYYAVMDLLAFPSYREGLPNAPLEAAAGGLPTVGYAAVGTVDAVESGRTGRLVSTGDHRALAEALSAYLLDPELRRGHGAAARDRAERLYRRQLVWLGWTEQYRRLLGLANGKP